MSDTPFTMRSIPSVLIPLGLTAALLLSSGCASIVSGYRIPDDTTSARNYSSVAGDIDVGQHSTVGKIDTVAGDIDIGEGSHATAVDSVAGKIRLAEKVTIDGSVETVAGDIRIKAGSTIGGGIESVAGDISIVDSLVKGDVTVRAGDLNLERSRIVGVVHLKKVKGDDPDMPRVTIGPGSEVREVIVDAGATVGLRIHRSAKVGKVSGAEAEYFD